MKPVLLVMLSLLLCTAQGCKSKPKEAAVFLDPAPRQWQVDESKLPKVVPNPYVQQDMSFGPWIARQDRLMQLHWEDKPFKKPVSCKVTVSKNGHLSDVQIAKTSGSKVVDEAATELIREAGPFDYLGGTTDHETFVVEFRDFPTVFFRRIKGKTE